MLTNNYETEIENNSSNTVFFLRMCCAMSVSGCESFANTLARTQVFHSSEILSTEIMQAGYKDQRKPYLRSIPAVIVKLHLKRRNLSY